MSFKTIFIIVATVLLTIILMQNTSEVNVKLLLWDVRVSFVVLMTAIAILCFLIGYISAYRKKKRTVQLPNKGPNDPNLSEEDKSYLE